MIQFLTAVSNVIYNRFIGQIRFLVVDFNEEEYQVTFLCYGGRAFFKKSLAEALLDEQLISGLAAEQACFLGIQFGQFIRLMGNAKINNTEAYQTKTSIAFDRKGNLIYVDPETGHSKIATAYAIASSHELISQFEPVLACRIGVHVGSQLAKEKGVVSDCKIILFTSK